jgi:hypothetical protein
MHTESIDTIIDSLNDCLGDMHRHTVARSEPTKYNQKHLTYALRNLNLQIDRLKRHPRTPTNKKAIARLLKSWKLHTVGNDEWTRYANAREYFVGDKNEMWNALKDTIEILGGEFDKNIYDAMPMNK